MVHRVDERHPALVIDQATVRELLQAYAAILRRLRSLGVVRTANAPASDYAEFLVWRHVGGTLEPNSTKGWDIRTPDGQRIQVKCRVISDPQNRGQYQLSPFRSFTIDAAAIVLFAADYSIWRAALLPGAVVETHTTYRAHINGWVAFADRLLDDPAAVDIADQLRAAADGSP